MFQTVAPRYDFITRAFSYGMDRGWKRLAVAKTPLRRGARVLDLACGTGDFSKLVRDRDATALVAGVDLAPDMLKRSGLEIVACADAMRLPFPDHCFDAVFVGYGLRNFPVLGGALAEIRRVIRRGGWLVSLDFFLPENAALRQAWVGYLYAQGAVWGSMLHGRPRVYTYIPDSLRAFVTIGGLTQELRRNGFQEVASRGFIFGGIGLHWASVDGT
jgi:demethylmenaquinone methyltransferase/2-methoxy-6-polyprenyl-1,4-benzoquinol methylase